MIAWRRTGRAVLALLLCSVLASTAATHYVVKNSGTSIPPYTNWATAARTIPDALGAASSDALIWVSNGTFDIAGEILIDRDIGVSSVNGPTVTIIDAGHTSRCVYLSGSKTTLSGFTLTGGCVSNDSGGGAYCEGGASIIDCIIRDNVVTGYSANGGGVCLMDNSRLIDSTVRDNSAAEDGGGVYVHDLGRVDHCVILSNTAPLGGGIYLRERGEVLRTEVRHNVALVSAGGLAVGGQGLLRSCIVADNSAAKLGGGLIVSGDGTLENCTVAGNLADEAGGIHLSNDTTVRNSIVYFNYPEDIYAPNPLGPDVSFSCIKPLLPGEGNFSLDPELSAAYRLTAGSPCQNAGSNQSWMTLAEDIDGEDRVVNGTVDIGASEFVTSSLSCNFIADQTEGFLPHEVIFTAHVAWTDPAPLTYSWDLDGDAVIDHSGVGLSVVTNVYTNYGYYTVYLDVTPEVFPFAKRTRYNYVKVGPHTAYVNPAGTSQYPYTNWAEGSPTLAAAVGAGVDGTLVLVTNAVYPLVNRVLVDRGVRVKGFRGAGVTIVDGMSTTRCFYLTHSNAVLEGLDIRNGQPPWWTPNTRGGGVLSLAGGSILNCILVSNVAPYGGGAFFNMGGLVTNTLFRTNIAAAGGGIYMQVGGRVEQALALDNTATEAGGFFIGTNAEIVNAWAYSNTAISSAGGFGLSGAHASNIYAQWNTAGGGGGALARGSVIEDSFFRYNLATNTPEGAGPWGGGGLGGGGIILSRSIMDGSTVFSNRAVASGGGIAALWDSVVTGSTVQANLTGWYGGGAIAGIGSRFDTCRFLDNTALIGGGLAAVDDSGAYDSLFSNNEAQVVGGVYLETSGRLERCIITHNAAVFSNGYGGGVAAVSNSLVMNCLIRNNTCQSHAGGGACGYNSTFRNCAVSGNRAGGWGGGIAFYGNGPRVENCTIIDNAADTGGGIGLYGVPFGGPTTGYVHNSIVYYNHPDPILENAGVQVSNSCVSILPEGPGNFDTPPDLADPANGDLHLLAGSPCIDAGAYEDWMFGAEDADGAKRIVGGVVDLGAYEFDAGALSCAPYAEQVEGSNTVPLVFHAVVSGVNTSGFYYIWDFDNDGAIEFEGYGLDSITNVMTGYGTHTLALTVTNALGDSFTAVREDYVHIGPDNVYVRLGGAPVYPYDTWAKAATGIHQAMAAAVSGSTIWISNGIHSVTQQLVLDRPIRMVGVNGAPVTHLDNDGKRRFFYLSHSNAVVRGLHPSVGRAYRQGSRDILPLSFSRGGGVYINRGGRVEQCQIEKCLADDQGGALYLYRGGEVTESEVLDNDAIDGAGLFLQEGGSISNCEISGNVAVYQGGGVTMVDGGWLGYSRLTYNVATNAAGVNCDGGGTVFACEVLTNFAHESAGGILCFGGGHVLCSTSQGNRAVSVGGLYGAFAGVLVSNSVFRFNQASNYGGGFMIYGGRVVDSEFSGNRATNLCGGLALGYTSILERCRIVLNTASNAGGLYLMGGEAEYCVIAGNLAHEDAGGGFVDGSSSITGIVRASLFSNNTAGANGGGAMVNDHAVLIGCDIVENVASNDGGGLHLTDAKASRSTIERNWAGGNGGGVYYAGEGDLRLMTINSNTADYGGGVFMDSDRPFYQSDVAYNHAVYEGGGAYVDGGGDIQRCSFCNNDANYGAGVYCIYAGTFHRCTVASNDAVLDGGGFLLNKGGRARWCTVTDNRAGRNGGGLLLHSGGEAMNTLAARNAATSNGGGVYFDDGQFLLACTVADNSAEGDGGGVYFKDASGTTNCIIYQNTAGGSGSNVYMSAPVQVIYSCTAPALAGPGNTSSNPLFAGGGDYHLTAGSPCIDTATGNYPYGDLDLVTRPLDGDGGGTAELDMGVYEFAGTNSDTDGDGLSDAAEVYDYGTEPTDPDTDDDEQSDGDEAVADTDPLDSTNCFVITSMRSTNGLPRFTWHGAATRLYDVQRSVAMTGEWLNVADGTNLAGAAGVMAYTNNAPWTRLSDSFRVKVRMGEP